MLSLFIRTACAESSWSSTLVKDFREWKGTTFIAIGVIVVLAIILLDIAKSSKKWNAKTIAFAGLAIAASFVLSCFRLYKMPGSGGSVTPGSMLPLMLFSAAFGVGPGLAAGLVYGLLQYLQGGYWLNTWQFILDYLLAFSAIGLAGIAHNKSEKWVYIGISVAALGRFVSAILAGLMWAADSLANGWALKVNGVTYSSSLVYSIVYNGVYLVPDTVICLLLAILIAKPAMKVLKAK